MLVHTGQHYDRSMSDVFFEELGVGPPDHLLGGRLRHPRATDRAGDGAPGAGCSSAQPGPRARPRRRQLDARGGARPPSKLGIPVGHIEAGLRSFDRTMPEEINRSSTDQISDLPVHPLARGARQPAAPKGSPRSGSLVGNTMIDTLVAMRAADPEPRRAPPGSGSSPARYCVVTLHRPALVDGPLLAETLAQLVDGRPRDWPSCSRSTRARATDAGAGSRRAPALQLHRSARLPRLPRASADAAAGVLTDSGGIQEETTYLGIPCFTLRDNTERPVTSSSAPTSCSAWTRRGSSTFPRSWRAATARPRRCHPAGTATPPSGWSRRCPGFSRSRR